jgi:hypothetical protein
MCVHDNTCESESESEKINKPEEHECFIVFIYTCVSKTVSFRRIYLKLMWFPMFIQGRNELLRVSKMYIFVDKTMYNQKPVGAYISRTEAY